MINLNEFTSKVLPCMIYLKKQQLLFSSIFKNDGSFSGSPTRFKHYGFTHTVFRFLPLPVLVQFEHVEEDLARQAALATAPIWREEWRRRLQWG